MIPTPASGATSATLGGIINSSSGRQSSSASAHRYAGNFNPFAVGDAEPSSNEWDFHGRYGIIHRRSCTICGDYIQHMGPFWKKADSAHGTPKPIYDVFYKTGLSDGVKSGRDQLLALQNEFQKLAIDRENVVDMLVEQQRELKELRTQVEKMEKDKQAAEARANATVASSVLRTANEVLESRHPVMDSSTQQKGHEGSGETKACYSRSYAALFNGVNSPNFAMGRSSSMAKPIQSSAAITQTRGQAAPLASSRLPSPHVYQQLHSPSTKKHSSSAISISNASSTQTSTLAKTNPRLEDGVEIWFDYYCTHQKSWPRGVRCDSQRRPILSDLRADRAVARFRPDLTARLTTPPLSPPRSICESPSETLSTPSPRNQFKNSIVELFAQAGAYAAKLYELRLVVAPHTKFEKYVGPFPVTEDCLVTFLAQSGVTRQMAKDDYEPWAQNYVAGVNCSIPFTPNAALTRSGKRRS